MREEQEHWEQRITFWLLMVMLLGIMGVCWLIAGFGAIYALRWAVS